MAKILKFEDLEIWQLARELSKYVEHLFEDTKLGQRYTLMNQMDRSSGSIMDNIAEGFERNGNREFINFLSFAKGSCGELKSQSYRALDKDLINAEQCNRLNEMVDECKNRIGAMMNYLNNCEIKGLKFK